MSEKTKKKIERVLFYILLFLICFMVVLCTFTYVNCNKIKDGSKYESLHEEIIEYLLDNDDTINDYKYIAVNANDFKITSVKEQTTLINSLRKYNVNILLGNSDILSDQFFTDENGSINGIYIYCDDLKLYANIVTETIMVKNEDTTIGYKVYAVHYFNKWHISYSSKFVE